MYISGGLTPLMLASFRGGGLDVMEEGEEEDDGSGNMIQDLLMQGANINMTTERTGKFHLSFFLKLNYNKNLKQQVTGDTRADLDKM